MENDKLRVAITQGDTNGIGYELIFKAFSELEMFDICTPIIYGSPKIASYHSNALNMNVNFTIINKANEAAEDKLNLLTCFDETVKVDLGTSTPASNIAAMKAMDRAMTDMREGLYDVLVSAPVNDKIKVGHIEFNSLDAYFKTCVGNDCEPLNIYVNGKTRMTPLSESRYFRDVMKDVTTENIINRGTLFYNCIKKDFRLSNPRIAILALNADADGREEREIIAPAVKQLAEKSINAFGPYTAFDFFSQGLYEAFDGVLTMYYDQGAVPFSALSAEEGICDISNLPFVCTTSLQSPSFKDAGKGIADEKPLRHAIYLAMDIYRNRATYEEPLKNPLRKLYHEKRDDSDKMRFNMQQRQSSNIQ